MPDVLTPPPDQLQRQQALDPHRSILVRAPAGSGKTDLLTRRFLRLLAEVDDPSQIVAITFTRAAAAEMRHRILAELEKSATNPPEPSSDEFAMHALARRALQRSEQLGWQLLQLPSRLRISTIDSFCRDLALQQPLLYGFGSDLAISDQPDDLYRRAARRTLSAIDSGDSALRGAIESLLLWRDNGWQEMEDLLVAMLAQRDRWMHWFLLDREPDWDSLRQQFEQPFAHAVRIALSRLDQLVEQIPGALDEVLALARFAWTQSNGALHGDLAELVEFPRAPYGSSTGSEQLEEARHAWLALAALLLADETFRKRVDIRLGFPPDRKVEKNRLLGLIQKCSGVEGFQAALAALRNLPPARYTDEDWAIVQACFILLRHAAAELWTVFAEAGTVDFTQVAQIARRILRDEDGLPTDAALSIADGIHHLLVDEFQDTSRRQHELLSSLVAAWPDTANRTLFVVGDPMQSIYFFRDADAELFPRVQSIGLELPDGLKHPLHFVPLSANFRTQPALVTALNQAFELIFQAEDGSGIPFSAAEPARKPDAASTPSVQLHLEFIPQPTRSRDTSPDATQRKEEAAELRDAARDAQTQQIVELIQSHMPRVQQARARGEKYRIAVLGRTRKALAPIALALRQAQLPFRAVELEQLQDRPEILDALALGRALLNPLDRVAWLGVLRAPWCGLSLSDLHTLASADESTLLSRPVPQLIEERLDLLSTEGRQSVSRLLHALQAVPHIANSHPTITTGTWLQQAWLILGGANCVDAAARANLDLLWRSLDALPLGQQDMLGISLNSALQKLTALPDPSASTECGVQLMTIHKSKGLEFEVVVVPELNAGSGRSQKRLLSWLERGIAVPDESGAITEFLVAPLPSKGADRGEAKAWVDQVYRDREKQEMRRLLYVAATRAREELHLFARPSYKSEDGTRSLMEPGDNLLSIAWPALKQEVQNRFDQWLESNPISAQLNVEVPKLAATGESNILTMPAPVRPTVLRRLPADFVPAAPGTLSALPASQASVGAGNSQLYERHQGGQLSRAFGNALHMLLQHAARLRAQHDWPEVRVALAQLQPRITAQIRASGIPHMQADSVAADALHLALQAIQDAHGQWILSPHPGAASEASWTGVLDGKLRTVRIDRIFRAGRDPLSEYEQSWWIIDFKTAHEDALDPAEALPRLRRLFAPQLEAYAAVLRSLHGTGASIRAALYYPRMALFDWWKMDQ